MYKELKNLIWKECFDEMAAFLTYQYRAQFVDDKDFKSNVLLIAEDEIRHGKSLREILVKDYKFKDADFNMDKIILNLNHKLKEPKSISDVADIAKEEEAEAAESYGKGIKLCESLIESGDKTVDYGKIKELLTNIRDDEVKHHNYFYKFSTSLF